MPAQLGPPSPGPSPRHRLHPPPRAGGQGVLFWFVFPVPPFFFFFHFSLLHLLVWHCGWGLLQLAGFWTFGQLPLDWPQP